jgi:hypothetical protein
MCVSMNVQAKGFLEINEGQKLQKCAEFSACLNKLEDSAKLAIPHKSEHWSNAAALRSCKDHKELAQFLRNGFEDVENVDPSGKLLQVCCHTNWFKLFM